MRTVFSSVTQRPTYWILTLYCITSIIQHQMFLDKILFKNFKEQAETLFDVTGDSLVKKTWPSSLNLTMPLSSSTSMS